ncbi:MAG: hypothetical protein L3J03_02870 [Desulfobacterales bacterium]|nr:hypothetical protein [Desulfobacterales bacterium]
MEQLPEQIAARLADHPVIRSIRRKPRLFTDTADFTAIDYGDIILLDGRYFLVTGYTREGRFGVDDQPKQWVPRVEDLASGQRLILKLVFHETFSITVGGYTIPCFRNPEKEARILEMVRGNSRFMQGYGVRDAGGNLVRVLDVIVGRRLDKYIYKSNALHRQYHEEELPGILREFLGCTGAIAMLHANGLRHGDIRRDHIFVEYGTNTFKWIDFDYDFYLPERPFVLDVLELGNLLMFLVGRGNYYSRDVLAHPEMGKRVMDTIIPDDMSLLSRNKVVNLRKLFPYISKELNDIFLHFSTASPVFYDTAEEFHEDLKRYVDTLG